MPSASGCSNMLPCTQCLQSGAQQTPSPRMHTLAHCCLLFDCFGIPANVVAVFTAHMKPRALPKATLPTCPCCTLYEQHTPCCTHRHTHKHMPACMLMCYCSRFRATPDESALRPCTLLCNFTHMPAATPVGCVSVMPLCSTFYVYFTHGCGSNCRRLLLAAGLVWLQCDHRVLTATHEFWCNPKATLLQGVQAQALHGISHA
jgi:hypothetical protein